MSKKTKKDKGARAKGASLKDMQIEAIVRGPLREDIELKPQQFSYRKLTTQEGPQWHRVPNREGGDFTLHFDGNNWTAQEGAKTFLTSGTISLNINELSKMGIGTCSIHSNEINQSEKYVVCKSNANKIIVYPVKKE